jgi:hypothetical protein
MDRLSKRKSRAVLIFAFAVLITAVAAEKFSPHKILWLIGLTVSIPLFAAILGGIPERRDRDQN